MTIYSSLGVRTLVNARGNATLAGGTLMAPEVIDAMTEAARSFVRIGDLQEAASRQIADLTGAEAGYVTPARPAALTLWRRRFSPARSIPDLSPSGDRAGRPRFLFHRTHRNPYDHFPSVGRPLVDSG